MGPTDSSYEFQSKLTPRMCSRPIVVLTLQKSFEMSTAGAILHLVRGGIVHTIAAGVAIAL